MSKISKMFKGSSSSSSSSKSRHRGARTGPSPQEAIHKLRETEAMLTKKQEYLEKKMEQEITIAKKNGTKNKRAALQALKRKKRFEQQLTQIDGTLSTIEFQREALENANTNTEVLKTMGFAAKAIKGVHQNMDLDRIDSLMQDITEQQEVAQEICDAISRPFGEAFDEDELLAELAELELEESMKNMGRLPSAPSYDRLPSVPSHGRLPSVPSHDRLPSARSHDRLPSARSHDRLPSAASHCRLPSAPSHDRLPSVPSHKLPSAQPSQRTPTKKRVEDDNDMQMLAAWGC